MPPPPTHITPSKAMRLFGCMARGGNTSCSVFKAHTPQSMQARGPGGAPRPSRLCACAGSASSARLNRRRASGWRPRVASTRAHAHSSGACGGAAAAPARNSLAAPRQSPACHSSSAHACQRRLELPSLDFSARLQAEVFEAFQACDSAAARRAKKMLP